MRGLVGLVVLALLLVPDSAGSGERQQLPRRIRTEQDCAQWRDALKRGQDVTKDIRRVAGRITMPVQAKTGDYNPTRLSVETDEKGRIVGASCD